MTRRGLSRRLDWAWNVHVFTWDDVPLSSRRIKERAAKLAAAGADTALSFGTHYLLEQIANGNFEKLKDRLREIVRWCHAYNIKVIEHRSAIQFRPLKERLITGEDIRIRGVRLRDIMQVSARKVGNSARLITAACPNNPLYQKIYDEVILEEAGTGIDGLMSDDVQFPDWYACVCKHCRRKFRKETGSELPLRDKNFWGNFENPLWKEWIKFRLRSTGEHHKRITGKLRKAGYNILRLACCSNMTGTWSSQGAGFSYNEYVNGCNLVFQEVTKFTVPFYSWYRKEVETKVFAALARDNNVPSLAMFYPRSRSEYFFCWSLAMALGQRYWGCTRRVSEAPVSLTESDRSNGIINWQNSHKSLFYKPESLADIAVFFSPRTRNIYKGMEDSFYTDEFAGWCEVLAEENFLYDVILDETLSRGDFSAYKLVILPCAACLDRRQAENIRRYIRKGGKAIITHETSLYDEKGRKLRDFSLSDVLGLKYMKTLSDSNDPLVVTSTGARLFEKEGTVIRNFSPVVLALSDKKSDVLATVKCTEPTYRFPGITARTFGKGSLAYFSNKPGCMAYRGGVANMSAHGEKPFVFHGEHVPESRKLMVSAVKELLGAHDLRLEVNYPPGRIYVSAYKTGGKGKRTVVHILNVNGAKLKDGAEVPAHWRAKFPGMQGKERLIIHARIPGLSRANLFLPSKRKKEGVALKREKKGEYAVSISLSRVKDYAILELM